MTFDDDRPPRRGPAYLTGPLAVVFLILGVVFAYLLLRLAGWARASHGSAYPVALTAADVVLLGGGAAGCWMLAGFLLWWRRRRR